jgi:hypothetical protein
MRDILTDEQRRERKNQTAIFTPEWPDAALGNNKNFTFRKEDFDCKRDVDVLKADLAGGAGVTPGEISNLGTFTNAVRNLFTGVVADPNVPGGFMWRLGHLPDIFTTTPNPTPPQVLGSLKFSYFYPPCCSTRIKDGAQVPTSRLRNTAAMYPNVQF